MWVANRTSQDWRPGTGFAKEARLNSNKPRERLCEMNDEDLRWCGQGSVAE